MPHVLFDFDTDKDLNNFIGWLQRSKIKIATTALTKMDLKPPIRGRDETPVSLFIGSERIQDGPLSLIKKRFAEEISAHSGPVTIRELKDKKWRIVHRRHGA
jgi:hypothetical protein